MKRIKSLTAFLTIALFVLLIGCKSVTSEVSPLPDASETPAQVEPINPGGIDENGVYSSKGDVALYIHTYNHLPANYITKKDAENAGWDSKKGNLWDVLPGFSIGGDRFGNYEGLLPDGAYKECDIDYAGGKRNAKRIVFSDAGSVYYTEDHYSSFEQLY